MKNFFTQSQAVRLFLAILLTITCVSAYSQIPGASDYLPQNLPLPAVGRYGTYV